MVCRLVAAVLLVAACPGKVVQPPQPFDLASHNEGLVFPDLVPPADSRIDRPVLADHAPDRPQARLDYWFIDISPATCLQDWSKWTCTASASYACTASCGSTLTIVCNLTCSCHKGNESHGCSGYDTTSCAGCQSMFTAGCCNF